MARPVRAIQELLPYQFPVNSNPRFEFLDRYPVGPGGSTVTLDFTPGTVKVGRVDYLVL